LSYAPEKIDKLFIKTNPLLLAEYKGFLSFGNHTLSSVVATCRTALSIFATDNNVALVTSHDTINFADFRHNKIALFINNSTTTMKYHAVTTSIFLDQFFEEIMSYIPNSKSVLPIFFLLDEASSLSFNNLQITISNLRKHFAGILQSYQSYSQIVDLYSQAIARAITENSYTRIYMSGQPLSVALELEALIGKTEYKDEKNARHVRSLLTANEIHELDESLIFCGNHPVIKTSITPYFRQLRLNWLSKIPPYNPENKIPFASPPILQFN
jgi:type IV secretory pathway TraG/TraD family ATPase VirD4